MLVPLRPYLIWWSSKLAADPLRDKADWPLTARTFFTRPDPRARRDVRLPRRAPPKV